MRESFKYDQVNKALRGRLDHQLRQRRERGDNLIDIAFWIRQQTGIKVTPESIRVWANRALAERVE